MEAFIHGGLGVHDYISRLFNLFAYVPQSLIQRMTVPKVEGKGGYKTFVTLLSLKNLLPGLLTILLKSIADTDIEIEKYRRYRYSTNRYFRVDVDVTGDIRRRIGGIKHRNRVQQMVTCR
jgi:hypothetical protein